MTSHTIEPQLDVSEAELIARLRKGDRQAFDILIRTYNQRLFRIARAIMREDMEAEDVVQEAYIKVFTRLDSFETPPDQNRLGAWLARITTNLAIDRLRKTKRATKLVDDLLNSAPVAISDTPGAPQNEMTPERQAAMSQIRHLLEREIDRLPDGFREVFVLRIVEEMSIEETADILQIPTATVKTRLHRARGKLQNSIKSQLDKAALNVFPFAGARCDRITKYVLDQLDSTGLLENPANK